MLNSVKNEVFTALYDLELKEMRPPSATVVSEFSENIASISLKEKILVFGNGYKKLMNSDHNQFVFLPEFTNSAKDMIRFSQDFYEQKNLSSLNEFEPYYLKQFSFKQTF